MENKTRNRALCLVFLESEWWKLHSSRISSYQKQALMQPFLLFVLPWLFLRVSEQRQKDSQGSLTSALLNGSFELCQCLFFSLPGHFWNNDGVKGRETSRRAALKEFQTNFCQISDTCLKPVDVFCFLSEVRNGDGYILQKKLPPVYIFLAFN